MTDHGSWFLGIDWGYETHQVCLVDATGVVHHTRRVDHDRAALEAYLAELVTHTGVAAAQIPVAIESPRGALVATLLERGCAVYAINPKQLDRFRDRHTAAGAKDDRRDAHVLADSLRTDRPAFRRVHVEDPVILQLRELARLEEDYARDLSRLTNQLRDQVYRIAPPLLRLCPAADEPWFWTILEAAPTPAEQQGLTRTAILTILRRHRLRRVTAADVLAAVRTPGFELAPGVIEATRDTLQMLIAHLRFVAAQRKHCERRQDALLAELGERPASEAEPGEHRDVEILASLPGVGRMTTVAVLTEATQPLATRDYDGLRTHIGTAPITKASGKRRLVQMRRACNTRLREAAYHWGRVSLQQDATTAAFYKQLRARGQTHGRALRSVVDRWLRILVAMLRHRTLYDPTRFLTSVPVPA
ncbi:MAG: IS110 family transposase [Vicinamibacterales bacterium]